MLSMLETDPKGMRRMKLRELKRILASMPQDSEVVVSLFKANGMIQAFEIDGITETGGLLHIEVSEEEGFTY